MISSQQYYFYLPVFLKPTVPAQIIVSSRKLSYYEASLLKPTVPALLIIPSRELSHSEASQYISLWQCGLACSWIFSPAFSQALNCL